MTVGNPSRPNSLASTPFFHPVKRVVTRYNLTRMTIATAGHRKQSDPAPRDERLLIQWQTRAYHGSTAPHSTATMTSDMNGDGDVMPRGWLCEPTRPVSTCVPLFRCAGTIPGTEINDSWVSVGLLRPAAGAKES